VSASVSGATDTSISATMTVDPAAPDESVTVSVQSHGYGTGFIETTSGQSSTGSNSANLAAIDAPTPTICYFGGSSCNAGTVLSSTQSVIVGQEIVICAQVSLPSGLSISSQEWCAGTSPCGSGGSNPPGTTVKNYVASTSGGSVLDLMSSDLTGSSLAFYWVDAATGRSITYTYVMSNGKAASAYATFNVDGPTSPSVDAPTGVPSIFTSSSQLYLGFDEASDNNGINVTASRPCRAVTLAHILGCSS
jgi:hypothetical protein